MGITTSFSHPYYLGGGVSTEVPGVFPIAIDGHPYLLDLNSNQFKRASLPLLRAQADQSQRPNESSLNPDDLWRRVMETWHKGAGQTYLDREDSDPARFNRSKGINPWTRWQIDLHRNVSYDFDAGAADNLYLAVAGDRVYFTHGSSVKFTTDITSGSYTDATGEPGTDITGIASNGYDVYIAAGTSGIYSSNRTISAFSSFVSGTVDLVAYVQGRLMATSGNQVYNITAAGALPSPIAANVNTDFAWVGFAEGTGQIYAAGFSGDKSLIFRTVIKPDGTALDAFVVAGKLPDGEIIRSIVGYLGFMVVGSDLGVRFCVTDGQGNLTIGPLIRTGPCHAFEPQDRFVWFGWDNFEQSDCGLGRMDLSVFTEPLAPAYASDLMSESGSVGKITSIITAHHGGRERRVFMVTDTSASNGLYVEADGYVDTGQIDSGQITYGIFDKKFGMYLDLRTEPLDGSVEAFVSTDSGVFTSIGTFGSLTELGTNGYVFPVGQIEGRKFEFRLVLEEASGLSPIVIRQTFRSYPAPRRIDSFMIPIMLYEDLNMPHGVQRHMDVQKQLEFLVGIVHQRRVVQYQEPTASHLVLIEDYEFQPHHMTRDGTTWNGTFLARLKTITE